MANKFKVEIQETVEELEHRLERAITAVSKEKLLLLYWIATKKIKTREELATMLKRDSSTIYRWLRAYKQGGITSLLTVKKAPGKTPHIPPEVREKLIEKLPDREKQVRANYSSGSKKNAELK
jgi:transposase